MDITTTQWIPTHWVTAIVNDDYSGLSDQEEQQIKEYLEETDGYLCCPDDEAFDNEQFRAYPDSGSPAANCIQVNVVTL